MHPPASGSPSPEPVSRFVPVALSKPVLAAALGIDGGAIFQILAVEDLELSASAIGIAFGMGLLSLPLQLWAARIPLRFARRNVQIFLLLAAIQSLLLAWLVATGATGQIATAALVVSVTAEVSISVLFATAWQPLLATRAASRDRQRINAGWAAMGRGLLAGLLIVFSAADSVGRSVLLLALAILAVVVAIGIGRITVTEAQGSVTPVGHLAARPPRLSPVLWWILASFTALNLGALPLWLVYVSEVMWPTADLGAIGAVQTVAVIAALVAWRPTTSDLGRRAISGVLLVVVGSVVLVGLGTVAAGTAQRVGVVFVTLTLTFGMMYASLALLEMAHRLVRGQQGVVRIFTIIDVVDSSALQLGLFIGGLLVTSSFRSLSWSPYVAFVAAMSVLALVAVWYTTRLAAKASGSNPISLRGADHTCH